MAVLLKNKIFLVFGLAMLIEAVVLVVALGGGGGENSVEASTSHHGEGHAVGEFVEFDLGEFKISNNSVEGSPMRIDCKIFAEVPSEYEHSFADTYAGKQHRVRDAIQGVIRGATYADVTDPDLAAVKRKLKKSVSDVIGSEKPFLSQIIVSDFQSYEL